MLPLCKHLLERLLLLIALLLLALPDLCKFTGNCSIIRDCFIGFQEILLCALVVLQNTFCQGPTVQSFA